MRRLSLAVLLIGMLFTGCTGVMDPVTADPGPIRATQLLRVSLDSVTHTWVPNWVDPANFQTVSVFDDPDDAT